MDNQQDPTAHGTLLSVWGSLDGREVWGRMDTCYLRGRSLCRPPATITTLLIGHTPV